MRRWQACRRGSWARPAWRRSSSRWCAARCRTEMTPLSGTRALLGKELRQHGWAMVGMSALLALAWFVARVTVERGARSLSTLDALPAFAKGPLVAAAL